MYNLITPRQFYRRFISNILPVFLKKIIRKIYNHIKFIFYKITYSFKTSFFKRILVPKFLNIFLTFIKINRFSVGILKRKIIKINKNYSPPKSKPLVSIIIPVYNQFPFTLRCLFFILKSKVNASFEVIVVDDCSRDETQKFLKKLKFIKYFRNRKNQGFLKNCNKAAKVSKGEYLMMLNNDTQVEDYWLDNLLQTFIDFPKTGIVGSKLIYPDGTLQEAGGIIWKDGSAWNFGKYKYEKDPIFNYAREVDYCSGAAIMIPKEIFNKFGGFDEDYVPAYCEDSDFALKVRSGGYRVIYQPFSKVIHFEGISSGRNLNKGVKKYQVINSKKQFSKWKDFLKERPPNGIEVDKAKDRAHKFRVLFIDQNTPTPDQDSGSIDAYNQMIILRDLGFQVTFIPLSFGYSKKYSPQIQRIGIEAIYPPFINSLEDHLLENGERYDLIFISRGNTFNSCINQVKKYCPKAKILFHTVDLHFLREERQAKIENSKILTKQAKESKEREISAIRKADVSTVISKEELNIISRILPNHNIQLLPLARSVISATTSFESRKDILFVGGFRHEPNVDAVKYFVREIMPLLRKEIKGVRFYIAGSNITKEILNLGSEDIFILGFVEKIQPLMNRMKLSVAPLRYGAGLKGKVCASMASGLPVVASDIAAEGFNTTNQKDLLIANSPQEFCTQIKNIYFDKRLWEKISTNGLELAQKNFGPEMLYISLSKIVSSIGFKIKNNKIPLKLYEE